MFYFYSLVSTKENQVFLLLETVKVILFPCSCLFDSLFSLCCFKNKTKEWLRPFYSFECNFNVLFYLVDFVQVRNINLRLSLPFSIQEVIFISKSEQGEEQNR